MTTKTKTQKAKVEPKVQVTNTVAETQPKVSTSEQKKSFKLPTFKNNMEKPCLYRLIKAGRNKKTGKLKYYTITRNVLENTFECSCPATDYRPWLKECKHIKRLKEKL